MSPRFFGNSDHPLFGIFHPARGRQESPHNVLLCPPVGHEYIRTHWALRTLASKLARQGMNVFRFDYRGMGDSALDISEVTSLDQWVEDTSEAAVELMETTGESCSSLSIIGLRLGAVIAALAATELAEAHVSVDNLIAWAPAHNGKDYLLSLRAMHHRMLDLWTHGVEPDKTLGHEEILGSRFHNDLLAQISKLELPTSWPAGDKQDGKINNQYVVIGSRRTDVGVDTANQQRNRVRFVATNDTHDWDDLTYIEEAWLPSDGPDQIAKLLQSCGTNKPHTQATETQRPEKSLS